MKRAAPLLLSLIAASTLRPVPVSATNAAREVEAAMTAGHYEYAYAQWKRILLRKPLHPDALTGLTRLEQIAQNLLEEAFALRNSDPVKAKDLLRTVVLITDPWSEINREARLALGDDL